MKKDLVERQNGGNKFGRMEWESSKIEENVGGEVKQRGEWRKGEESALVNGLYNDHIGL